MKILWHNPHCCSCCASRVYWKTSTIFKPTRDLLLILKGNAKFVFVAQKSSFNFPPLCTLWRKKNGGGSKKLETLVHLTFFTRWIYYEGVLHREKSKLDLKSFVWMPQKITQSSSIVEMAKRSKVVIIYQDET